MKKYFTDSNRLVLYFLPEASKRGASGDNKQEMQREEN